MTKTAAEVESDMFALINTSAIKTAINGSVYKEGTRPIDSTKEDAVITFLTGIDDQIQTGAINVNIYIPDIDNGSGTPVKNISRCRTIEILANQIVKGLTPGQYRWQLGATIQTFRAEEIGQHFVNAKIKFYLATF